MIAMLTVAMIGTACSASVDSVVTPQTDGSADEAPPVDDDTSASGDTPVAPPTGEFTSGECGFDIPADATIECGTVSVPENYADPDGASIELAVAVLRSTSADPAAVPTIYLEGGPGGHAVETIPFVYDDRYVPLLAHSDVIVFDQRGAGLSSPRLTCPEADETYEALALEPDLSTDEQKTRVLESLETCSSRLTDEGIDLSQYNTENNAHDVDLIRDAVGAPQLDLFGISYGTRLALATIRLHGDIVRSAALDSTLSPEVDATAETQASLIGSYERVIAACEADTACATEFPDLDARFRALYEQLEAEPVLTVATDFLDGDTQEGYLDGDAFLGLTFGALYDPYTFTDLPELVADLETGSVALAESYLSLNLTNDAFFSDGMFLSFACHDEVAFSTPEAVAAARPADPLWATALDTSENVGSFSFEVCEVWGSGAADQADNEPVTGSMPVLFLAGEFDPVTPPEWADAAAASLDNAAVLRFPTLSHGVTGDECGMAITAAFIADPNAVSLACMDDLAPPLFVGVASSPIVMEPYTADIDDFNVRVTSVHPDDWTLDVSGIQASRGGSLSDETALAQLGAPAGLASQFATLVGQELGIDPQGEDTVSVGGRSWRHISGTSLAGDTIDVWAEDADGTVPIVVLVTTVAERDQMLTNVAIPALEAIQVTDL